ncbi:MAG: hypothetical protein KF708_04135 [Pirellulales bacterium]|nr:hypothetical protein [Pirellulales bacterium]
MPRISCCYWWPASILLVVIALNLAPPVTLAAPKDRPAIKTSFEQLSWHEDVRELIAALGEEGPTLQPLLPRSVILSASGRLRPQAAAVVMRRLSDPAFIARLEPTRPEIANVFAGLSTAIPLLDEIEPEVQLIVARQSFRDAGDAVPMGKFPAVALVFVPQDTRRAKQLFLSAFWAAMAQANETAKLTGRPRLRMESRRRGDGFFAGATFVPLEGEKYRGLADYNVSPAIGTASRIFVLSSSKELAAELVELAAGKEPTFEHVPGSLRIDVGPVAAGELMLDNVPSVADLLFDDDAALRRAVHRVSDEGSRFLAALPHPRWQLPSRPLALLRRQLDDAIGDLR